MLIVRKHRAMHKKTVGKFMRFAKMWNNVYRKRIIWNNTEKKKRFNKIPHYLETNDNKSKKYLMSKVRRKPQLIEIKPRENSGQSPIATTNCRLTFPHRYYSNALPSSHGGGLWWRVTFLFLCFYFCHYYLVPWLVAAGTCVRVP